MRLLTSAAIAASAFLSISPAHAQSFNETSELGLQALRRGEWARSIEINTSLLSMKPPKPEQYCFIYWGLTTARVNGTGEMERALRDIDESLRCLEAIRNSPAILEFRAEAYRQRGILLRDWGRYDDALANEALRLKVDPQAIHTIESARASALEMKGDYEAAAQALTRGAAAAKDPEFRKSLIVRRAWIRMKQRRVDQAMSDLAEANRIKPHVAGTASNPHAWVLVEQGRYDDAIVEMKVDERAGPGNAMILGYLRGHAEAARGNFSEAVAAFRPAAAAQAANPTVQVALYLAQARSGRNDTAAISTFAANLDPAKWPDAQAFYVLGRINRNQFEASARHGNLRIERARMCRMTLVAGEVALIKGDKAAARTELNRTIELCPMDTASQERTWAMGELGRL